MPVYLITNRSTDALRVERDGSTRGAYSPQERAKPRRAATTLPRS